MRIAVVGDMGVDRYLVGRARGLSAEAPIPILDHIGEMVLPGMGANVWSNLTRLGAEAWLVHNQPPSTFPLKTRLVTEDGHQLARWDRDDHCEPITSREMESCSEADAIVVADYGKGSIGPEAVEILRDVSESVPVFVDTKSDPSRWMGSEVWLFPNWKEYTQYKGKYEWMPRVVLKRGAEGLAYMEYGSTILQRPALATHVRCVNGAGDTTLAAFVTAYLDGWALPRCLEFANCAAALVVEQSYTTRWTTRDAVETRWAQERGLYDAESRDEDSCGESGCATQSSGSGAWPGCDLPQGL